MRRSWRLPPIAVLVVAVALAAPVPARARPAEPQPPTASPAIGINGLWTTYGDTAGQWTGGDRTTSVPLPDGRTAWFYSDTFLGTVNADHSRPANSAMPRNTLVVQGVDGRLGATLHGGTDAAPTALVGVAGSGEHYWVADGKAENGVLRVLYNRYQATGGGGLDVKSTGTSLATFSLPGLQLTDVRPLPLSPDVAWGSELLDDGGYTYIYGADHGSDAGKYLKLARVPSGGLAGAWQFWTGSDWSAQEADAARMLVGVGTAFSVTKIGSEYVLVTMDSSIPFNPTVIAYTASAPTGPFGHAQVLYQAPEAATPGIIAYDATVHPQLGGPGTLVVSYNVNSLDPADDIADVRIYRPRFLDVTWPPPAPDAKAVPPAPSSPVVTTAGDGGVRLSWQAVPDVDGYRVYQRDVTAGQTEFVRRPQTFHPTTADIGLLLAGHQYEFRVTAENDHGESVLSTPVGTAVQTAPPRDLRAVPHDLGAALSSEPARPGVRVPCVCIAGLTMRWSTAPK